VHHPASVPVGYQATLSQYLHQNDTRDSRSRSGSPYRLQQCPFTKTYTSGSKLQDSYISKTVQAHHAPCAAETIVHQDTSQKVYNVQAVTEESFQTSVQTSTQQRNVNLPLTDFYANKFSGSAKQDLNAFSASEGEN